MGSHLSGLSVYHISKQELYVSSNKRDKMAISRSIVEAVRARSPPGRFLEKDEGSGKFYVIDEKDARLKASQALREEKGRKKKK